MTEVVEGEVSGKSMHKLSSNLFYYFSLIFIEWMLLSLETAELNMCPEIQHF